MVCIPLGAQLIATFTRKPGWNAKDGAQLIATFSSPLRGRMIRDENPLSSIDPVSNWKFVDLRAAGGRYEPFCSTNVERSEKLHVTTRLPGWNVVMQPPIQNPATERLLMKERISGRVRSSPATTLRRGSMLLMTKRNTCGGTLIPNRPKPVEVSSARRML